MPGPLAPLLPSIITAAGIGIGQGINALSQGGTNRKTREWNEKMYGIQRADALSDWARTNQYNSPLAQMQRFKEAGLNPNLIYGQTNMAQPVRSTDVKSWNPQAPAFNLGQIVDQYLQTRQAGASIDIMKEQKENLKLKNDGQRIQNIRDGILIPYTEPKAKAQVDSLLAGTDYTRANTALALGRNSRETLRSTDDHATAVQRVIGLERDNANKITDGAIKQQTLTNLGKTERILVADGQMKELQVLWKKFGLTDNSSRVEWILAQYLMDPDNATKKLQDYIKAMGQLATSGAKQTGQTIKDTLSTLWQSIWE